jgi:hypothetical protein
MKAACSIILLRAPAWQPPVPERNLPVGSRPIVMASSSLMLHWSFNFQIKHDEFDCAPYQIDAPHLISF